MATKNYNFKVVDYCTTSKGYLFKLATIGQTPREYNLMYVPFGRYTSVLMMDFLLAGKRVLSSDLMNDLTSAVREEIEAQEGDFILLGDKGSVAPGVIEDTLDVAWRVNNDKKLAVFKGSLATRNYVRNLGKLSPEKVAIRIHENRLVLDYLDEGHRPYTKGATVTGRQVAGLRDSTKRLDVLDIQTLAQRVVTFDMFLGKGIEGLRDNKRELQTETGVLSHRIVTHELEVLYDRLFAHRCSTKGELVVQTESYLGVNPRTQNVYEKYLSIFKHSPQFRRIEDNHLGVIKGIDTVATKHIARSLSYLNPLEGVRDIALGNMFIDRDSVLAHKNLEKGMFIGRETFKARLKNRQYPTYLHYALSSRRIIDRQEALVSGVLTGDRDIKRQMYSHTPPRQFERLIERELHSHSHVFDGLYLEAVINRREINQFPLVIHNKLMNSFRQYQWDSHIPVGAPEAKRLYTVKGFVEGGAQALRDTTHGLVVPQGMEGRRDRERALDVASEAPMAERTFKMEAFIDSKFKVAKRDSEVSVYLPKGVLAERTLQQLGLTVTSATQGTRDSVRELSTKEYVVLDALRNDTHSLHLGEAYKTAIREGRKSLHLDDLWKAVRRNEKHMHLVDKWLDILVGGGGELLVTILQSYLMEDMLLGELLHEPGYIETHTYYADRASIETAYLEPGFLAGARDRIDALIGSGILSANKSSDSGILTFDFIEALVDSREAVMSTATEAEKSEMDRLKPGFIDMSDPLGYINADPSEFSSDLLAGSKPKQQAHLQDGASLGSVPKRAGAVVYDIVMAVTTEQFGYVGEGTEGSRWEVHGQLLDEELEGTVPQLQGLVELTGLLGEVPSREGALGHESILSSVPDRLGATVSEGILGKVLGRQGTTIRENTLGESLSRQGVTTIENSLGIKVNRGGCVELGDSAGHRIVHGGAIDLESNLGSTITRDLELQGSQLVIGLKEDRQGEVVGQDLLGEARADLGRLFDEQPKGVANHKLAEVDNPNEIMADFKARVALLVSGFVFGKTEEDRVMFLEQLTGMLPERTAKLVEDYHLARREQTYSSFMEDGTITGKNEKPALVEFMDLADKTAYKPQQGDLDEMLMAQGFLYNYEDTYEDILKEGMDVENWGGWYGFGVPEDYDPHDPFNVYYPWTTDHVPHAMTQWNDWSNQGNVTWEVKDTTAQLQATNSSKDNGLFIYNKGDHSSYKFSTDFKVDGDEDKAVGVVFMYKGEYDYYTFSIHGGDKQGALGMRDPMQLFRTKNGQRQPVGLPMSPFPWKKGNWHNVEVKVMGDRVLIQVDGILQYDIILNS